MRSFRLIHSWIASLSGKSMKRFIKPILVFWLIGWFLVGCKSLFTHPNVFDSLVCEPPCWENITPGITTKMDALGILSNLKTVDQPVYDSNQSFGNFDDELRFSLYGNSLHGSMLIFDDQVSTIVLGSKLDITFQRAIELFGTPQSILIIRSGEIYAAMLLNPEKGIAFSYFLADRVSEIQPEDEITNLIFFDPKDYELLLDSGIFTYHQLNTDETLRRLQSWEGFGNVDKYFPEAIH